MSMVPCGKCLDGAGHHAATCSRRMVMHRHHQLRDLVAELCQRVGYGVTIEQKMLTGGPRPEGPGSQPPGDPPTAEGGDGEDDPEELEAERWFEEHGLGDEEDPPPSQARAPHC